jgi:ABC-2 type transport system ATP-binding protein
MADMRLLVRRLGAAGCTVLLSSHLMAEAQELCDRVGVIAGGRLVAESTVAELRGEPGLRLVASPLADAAAQARSLLGADAVEVSDGGLRLTVPPQRAAEVNAALVGAGIAVSELRRDERSLEEAFLALTTGAGNA